MRILLKISLILFCCAIVSSCMRSPRRKDVGNFTFSFAAYYGDHMVLQKAPQAATVWGYGEEVGSDVVVTGFDHEAVTTTVTELNTWSVKLPPIQDTNSTYNITAKSQNKSIMLKNVLFGDIWICSGQSNMVFTLDMANDAQAEMQEAKNYSHIRVFTASQETSDTPLTDLKGVAEPWSIPSQDTVGHKPWTYFSAVCWLYGKLLYQNRGYPIGLITSAWGGTAIELWSSANALAKCGIKEGKQENLTLTHSSLWNAMMAPFTRLTIYGVVWYQGEANAGSPDTYNCTFPEMIADWRKQFTTNSDGQTNSLFPFGFVQLAPNRDRSKYDISTGFPDIRWHQTADMGYVPNYYMSNVFMAVAMDLPDFSSPYGSIHPRYKQDVASRLLTSALAVAYNKHTNIRYQGPQPDGYSLHEGDKTIRIGYDNRSTHLDIRSMEGFEVCCSTNNRSVCNKFDNSSRWMPAPIVEYDAFSVRVWYAACADNEHVVGLRYEWRESPCDLFRCAIYSKENGLPAPPMITVGTFGNNKYNRIRARKRVTY
ncbi:sialate O-acetylesterase [Mytilus galloprovincialis]|uniref:Sialate O-acetylesterase n=1 Tax=Mytilus galloprovincialis TaxID=29158 RepID=A0A8B6E4N6_MYTGA|nr:sialate O-acetylesterase [Mytilus galloprovincialis]